MEEGVGDGSKAQPAYKNNGGIDTFKKEVGRHSNGTASSSSKISGSRKSKTNMERRDYPVGSVSLFPLRNSKAFKPVAEVSKGKSDIVDGHFITVSPKQNSHEFHGACEQSELRKDNKTISSAQNRKLESNRILEPRDQVRVVRVQKEANFKDGDAKDRLFANIFGSIDDEASPSHDEIQTKPGVLASSEQPGRPLIKNANDNYGYQERHGPCNSTANKEHNKRAKSFTARSKVEEHTINNDISDAKIKISNSLGSGEDLCPRKDASDSDCYGQNASHEDLRNEYNYIEKEPKKILVNTEGKRSGEGKGNKYPSSRMQVNVETTNTPINKSKFSDPSVGGNNTLNSGDSNKAEGFRRPLTMQNEKHPQRLPVDRVDKLETKLGGVVSEPLPYLGINGENVKNQASQVSSPKQNRHEVFVEAVNNDDLAIIKEPSETEDQNGRYNNSSRHMTSNGVDASTSAKRIGKQSAVNVIKEARDLKHSANRLRKVGLESESTGLYFQAALKFLYGASLMELSNLDGFKQGNMTSSIQMYHDTAKLCEFCAVAYENHKEMAFAALAYKCMEVAYLKVVYSKHTGARKDCLELQAALPIGESPSSSASDVDNPNHQAKLSKAVLDKANSPQVVGKHVIAARNRPNFDQILVYAGYVNSAMEASRKSLNAFASASSGPVNRPGAEEMQSIRRVLDSSFHDVEGLLRLVRLSMELFQNDI